MNYLVIALLIAAASSGRVEAGLKSHVSQNKANTRPTPTDSLASASGPANSYLPASLGYQGPLAVPMILPDGTIAETPEVAAARAAHLAALEAARATDPDMGKDDGEYDPRKYGDDLYGVVSHSEDLLQSILSYQALARGGGAPAPVYGAPGAGMQSLSKAMSDASAGGAMYASPGSKPSPAYGAPSQASNFDVPSQDSGYNYDAPSQASSSQDSGYNYDAPSQTPAGQNMPYTGPLAMLQLLASGFLEDTPEVLAARNTHLKALQEAQAAAAKWRAKQAAGASQAHPWG